MVRIAMILLALAWAACGCRGEEAAAGVSSAAVDPAGAEAADLPVRIRFAFSRDQRAIHDRRVAARHESRRRMDRLLRLFTSRHHQLVMGIAEFPR
jgi:hypothetical protein